MTRKHFEAIAQEINLEREAWESKDVCAETALKSLTKRLAQVFINYNSNFDSNRFIKACGF